MKKIFRLSKAELSKIFMRPSMIILTTVLVLTLILSFILFSPSPGNTKTKYTYDKSNTSDIYTAFQNECSTFEANIKNEKLKIDNFTNPKNDIYENFKIELQELNDYYYFVFVKSVEEISKTHPDPTKVNECKDIFIELKSKVNTLKDYLPKKLNGETSDNNKTPPTPINFYITTKEYENLNKFFGDMYTNLPERSDLDKFTIPQIIERKNAIIKNFNLEQIKLKFASYKKIEINEKDINEILDKYFYPNFEYSESTLSYIRIKDSRLDVLYNNVIDYYYELGSTGEKEIVNELNIKVAQYVDYVNICKNLIGNNFELLRIGMKTDDQIVQYQGFTKTSKYNLQKQIATSKYFFENNTFGYEYLNAFNFGINSGVKTNVYDFTFFAMQLLSLLITIFAIYFASTLINGEQNTGTLKMAATRPYTRNKIFSGKFLACMNVSLILLIVSFISSFVVGVASFGFTSQQVLVIMNASKVVVMHPLLLMGIYFLSVFIDIIFYISLSILISMLIKPTTINTAVSTSIVIVSTIMLGTVGKSWIRFIPSLHLGLYKFFTNSRTSIFSFSVVPNFNMVTSFIVIIISIITFDLIGRFLFTHRSIDK